MKYLMATSVQRRTIWNFRHQRQSFDHSCSRWTVIRNGPPAVGGLSLVPSLLKRAYAMRLSAGERQTFKGEGGGCALLEIARLSESSRAGFSMSAARNGHL